MSLNSDEELVLMAQKGDDIAINAVLSKFKPLVRSKARSFFLVGGDKDDIIQEGMIGLFKAIRDYTEGSFIAFASVCILRNIITAINKANRQKNIPLNNYIAFECNEESIVFSEEFNPENITIKKESGGELNEKLSKLLSNLESDVLHNYLFGLSYAEIADKLTLSEKSVDNAIQRIKAKIRESF